MSKGCNKAVIKDCHKAVKCQKEVIKGYHKAVKSKIGIPLELFPGGKSYV